MKKMPVFLCYRQADGSECANLIYEAIHGETISEGIEVTSEEMVQSSEIDVYFDQTAAAVGNWQILHEPHLKRSRALIVICSPGAAYRDPNEDWVHKEIDWWLENRPEIAPILVESTSSSGRFVPPRINEAWPDIQRLSLDVSSFEKMSKTDQERTLRRLKERVLNGISPSSENFYHAELLKERQRVAELEQAISLQQNREREVLSLTWLYQLTKDHASGIFSGAKHHQSYLVPLLENSPDLVSEKMDAALEEISSQGVPLEKGELLDLLGSKGFFRLILDLFSKKNAYARIQFKASFLDPMLFFTHDQLVLLNTILRVIDCDNVPKVLSRYGSSKTKALDDSSYLDVIFESLASCNSLRLSENWPEDDFDRFFALSKHVDESPEHGTILDSTNYLKYRSYSYEKGNLSNAFTSEAEFEAAFFQAHFRPMILAALALQAEVTKQGKADAVRYNRLCALYRELSCIKVEYANGTTSQRAGAKFDAIPVNLRLKTYADLLRDEGHENAATSLFQLERNLASHLG